MKRIITITLVSVLSLHAGALAQRRVERKRPAARSARTTRSAARRHDVLPLEGIETLDELEARDITPSNGAFEEALRRMQRTDAEPSEFRTALGVWMDYDPDAAAASGLVQEMQAGIERDRLAADFADHFAGSDIEAALEWLERIEDHQILADAAQTVAMKCPHESRPTLIEGIDRLSFTGEDKARILGEDY